MNIDKQQLNEQKSIDRWLMINTIFTIVSGLAMLYIAFKK